MKQNLIRLASLIKRKLKVTSSANNTLFEPLQLNEREKLSLQFLKGKGIEIGALHNPTRVFGTTEVQYVDYLSVSGLRKAYPELKDKSLAPVSIVDDGETLQTILPNSQDFCIANHMIEHSQNVIRTLQNFQRVLKPGGILFLAVPDRRYTFDHLRPGTPTTHIIDDFELGAHNSFDQHVREWVTCVEGIIDEQVLKHRVESVSSQLSHIHYHAWTNLEFLILLSCLIERGYLNFEIEGTTRNGLENIFILRKICPFPYKNGALVEFCNRIYLVEGEALRHVVSEGTFTQLYKNNPNIIKLDKTNENGVVFGLPLTEEELAPYRARKAAEEAKHLTTRSHS